MALGKGIPVINGFDLNSKLPLDSRAVADTKEEMNALVANESVGDGQLCYCKADKKMYVLKDNVWSEVGGGGGKSVPPTLNLMDLSGDIPVARTSITEEEYNNYSNYLYSSVYFIDSTLGNNANISVFFPEFVINTIERFAIYKVSINDETSTLTPTHLILYRLKIGEKDAISGNYSITIEKEVEFPLGSGGGSSASSYPYLTGSINASDTQTSSFPKTDSETRVVTIENLDLSKLLNTKTIIVDADADASEVFNIACGAYGETEGIGQYVSSISCDKKTNNLFFFYINMDIQTGSLIMKRKTIPTSTTTITFED